MSFVKKILAATKNAHFQSLLGNGVVALFGLLITAILYRVLSKTDISIYLSFLVYFGLVDTLRSGFLTFAFIKFYSGAKVDKANEITGSTWFLSLVITGGLVVLNVVVVLMFSSHITDGAVIFFLKYFSWMFLAGLPFFMASLVVQGDKRFDRLLWLRFVNQILFTVLVIALVVLGKATLDTVLLAYIASNLAASLVAVFCGWTMIGTIKYVKKNAIAELFHFGKYSFGTNLSATLFRVTDVFFINLYLGPVALAVYFLGGRLVQIIEIPLGSFVSSGMPSLSEYYNNGEKKHMMLLMKKMIGMVSIAFFIIAIFSVIFADPMIMLIGGAKYIHSEAPNLFRIFMCVAILYPTDRFFAVTLDVIHKPKINFYKILIMLTMNLIGDYVGVTVFKSVYGVVFANVFTISAAILIAYVPINKYSKFNFWNMYIIGYRESVLLIKQTYQTMFGANVNKI